VSGVFPTTWLLEGEKGVLAGTAQWVQLAEHRARKMAEGTLCLTTKRVFHIARNPKYGMLFTLERDDVKGAFSTWIITPLARELHLTITQGAFATVPGLMPERSELTEISFYVGKSFAREFAGMFPSETDAT
jgi:hypothetical protein